MQRPVFAPHYSVHRVEPDTLVLLSETQELALRGEFYYLMAPHMDGRTTDEIAQAMQAEATPEEVHQAIEILQEKGFIQESLPERPREASFWSAMGLNAEETLTRLEQARVAVVALGALSSDPFCSALADWGIGSSPGRGTEGPAEFEIVLVEDVLEPQLEQHNRQALEQGRPWLLVRPLGRRPWLGPFFVPGSTACWECLAQRQRFNRQLEISLNGGSGGLRPTQARGALRGSLGWVAQQVAVATARWLTSGRCPQLEGQLQTVDLLTGEVENHSVIRRPQCPACGTPQAHDPRIQLRSTQLGGGYRAFSPQETLKRFGPHVSRLTGVVSRLEQAQGTAGSPIHVFNSGYNLSRPMTRSGFILGREFRSLSSGKGKSPIEARAGALAEAVERYCAAYTGEETRRRASLQGLADEAVDPRSCMLFSQEQYTERETWNKTHKPMHQVPFPYDPEAEMDWSPLWSLSQDRVRYLPTGYLYYLAPKDKRFFLADSNGNAAGTSLEDAILQGFFELVERDGVALWWYTRALRPGVNLESFGEPYFLELRDHYEKKLGRDLWALDVTTDLGIPTFVAGSADLATRGKIMLGFGAHREASIALQRALTEANQFLSMLPSLEAAAGQEDDPTKPETTWYHQAFLSDHAYTAPDPSQPERSASDYAHGWNADGKESVERCQRLVEARGLEFLVLDQTRADVGMPVVKVMVPGMRHFWPRYAPGRLYQVPVELGWRAEPLSEAELNPHPIFW